MKSKGNGDGDGDGDEKRGGMSLSLENRVHGGWGQGRTSIRAGKCDVKRSSYPVWWGKLNQQEKPSKGHPTPCNVCSPPQYVNFDMHTFSATPSPSLLVLSATRNLIPALNKLNWPTRRFRETGAVRIAFPFHPSPISTSPSAHFPYCSVISNLLGENHPVVERLKTHISPYPHMSCPTLRGMTHPMTFLVPDPLTFLTSPTHFHIRLTDPPPSASARRDPFQAPSI
jgi:hypothetical protein